MMVLVGRLFFCSMVRLLKPLDDAASVPAQSDGAYLFLLDGLSVPLLCRHEVSSVWLVVHIRYVIQKQV